MTVLYLFLGAVVVYCLVQSVRFRIATWQHRTLTPDVDRVVDALARDSDVAMENAFLTEEGRKLNFRQRAYDFVGLLAALALALLWLGEKGII